MMYKVDARLLPVSALIAISCALLLSITPCQAEGAQKRPRKTSPARTRPAPEPRAAARMIGSPVVLVTRNGDRVQGTLLDITAFSVKVRSENLDSFHALDTLASINFGTSVAPPARNQSGGGPVSAQFSRDAEGVIGTFTTIVNDTRSGIEYSEYGRQLVELRRASERFIARYSTSENGSEAHIVANLAGALTDFTWARTVWTLGFGRASVGSVRESDSPAISDAISLYPDLRTSAANGGTLAVDKLVSGLWRRAGEKVDRARSMIDKGR
ncbi:MAG TPA: hypothetical protein VKC34_05630 [Blastocatellia bacterium]|nr:hypothetical protein [Blastocatellia bacterium]